MEKSERLSKARQNLQIKQEAETHQVQVSSIDTKQLEDFTVVNTFNLVEITELPSEFVTAEIDT